MTDKQTIEMLHVDDGSLRLKLSGNFTLADGIPACADMLGQLNDSVNRISLIDNGISDWDSALLVLLSAVDTACRKAGITLDIEQMPTGVQRLIRLAAKVPERQDASRKSGKKSFLERVGTSTLDVYHGIAAAIYFLGQVTISLARLCVGKARFRKAELWLIIQQCGPQALGIVATISVLVGVILAFVGAIQLKMFGAEIYVANLVGLGMVMEMGALMTGIILAGRTGAAFAAQIGTMQVNEEIDALQTMGIPPVDYLVLPRMLALILMTPLLVLYANILGILGGAVVGIFLLDIPPRLYFDQTFSMMTVWQCAQGLIKGSSFGLLVAISGCMRGLQCGRSASAVGDAATSAVVTSIVLIVVVDAMWTFFFMMIG